VPFAAVQSLLVLIAFLGGLTGLIWGVTTSGQRYEDAHLDRGYGIVTATPARRLSTYLLEIPLFFFTFAIGWFIWFAIVAPRGQTPAKSLLSTYVVREDGRVAGGWFMWGRELLVKGFLFWLLYYVTVGAVWVVASLWCLWNDDKQCLWDRIMSSYVAYSPYESPRAPGQPAPATAVASGPSDRLRELQQLRAEGVITAEEYEERRQRLAEHIS
jgi:uncharacterized RDD family membrane protein YckC